MTITNQLDLPEPLVRAVTFSDRKRGDAEFTITELIQPPRISALTRQHFDEITEDASDRLWLLMGSAGHEVLRRSAKHGIVEERADVEWNHCKISGQPDYAVFEDTLWDYKFTSLYAVKEGPKPEWVQQLNCYRWLLNKYGVEIKHLKICCIFRDWSLPESKRSNGDYPKHQVQVFDLPLWPFERTESWLSERIAAHQAALKQLPECTPDETWQRPEKWAVMKKGAQRATKLYEKREEAVLHATQAKLEIEHRPGERPRCEHYCAVSEWCEQFKAWKAKVESPVSPTPPSSSTPAST